MKVIIPAAGKGTRSGLSYPKTLKVFDDIPLLMRTLLTVSEIDKRPVIIVSPEGKRPIEKTISQWAMQAEILVQEEPLGLGDAILCFRESEYFSDTKDVLVIWGDMISVQIETLKKLMRLFRENESVFAFPSKVQSPCYTYVTRHKGRVISLIERQEFGDALPPMGESDVGIFMFDKEIVFNIMKDPSSLIGKNTKEIGFLQIVSILSGLGWWVDAFPIADEIDSLSFNTPDDLKKAAEVLC